MNENWLTRGGHLMLLRGASRDSLTSETILIGRTPPCHKWRSECRSGGLNNSRMVLQQDSHPSTPACFIGTPFAISKQKGPGIQNQLPDSSHGSAMSHCSHPQRLASMVFIFIFSDMIFSMPIALQESGRQLAWGVLEGLMFLQSCGLFAGCKII